MLSCGMIDVGTGVRRATLADMDGIAALFDAYRQFYGQPPRIDAARAFLLERFERGESTLWVAGDELGSLVGFAQLFPMFSSVALGRTFVLNDLFVAPGARRRGVARALLNAAAEWGRENQAVRITLSTQTTNAAARALYASLGWALQTEFEVYTLRL
jgi:ribosomal protein S18 acetylase RimI-like enzyme